MNAIETLTPATGAAPRVVLKLLGIKSAHTKEACKRAGGVWRKGTRHRHSSCARKPHHRR